MDLHSQMIFDEYLENRDTFETMKDIVLSSLKKMLADDGLLVTVLEGRVKEANSLKGKLDLKGYKYKSLSDITDILGCRIVAFYTDDVDRIASLVDNLFTIDWDNSVDKRRGFEVDQFGYMSLHYICQIPEKLYKDPARPNINQFKFEIQMRTALQHMWATAYHDTGYKSAIEVPAIYLRRMNRLAGLLEMADEEFSDIIKDISVYRKKVGALVKQGNLDELSLNADTFLSYLEIGPFDNLNQKIASLNNMDIEETSYMPYLDVLLKLEFKTLRDVADLIKEYSEPAFQLAAGKLAGKDLDIVASSVGIRNLLIAYILKTGQGKPGLRMFYKVLYGEAKDSMVDRTYKEGIKFGIIKEEN